MRQIIPETRSDYDNITVIERPDGFYWQEKGEERESGPFPTFLEAIQDIDARTEMSPDVAGEVLAEAESEFGVSEWIDASASFPMPTASARSPTVPSPSATAKPSPSPTWWR